MNVLEKLKSHKVGVLLGGDSHERDISLKTGSAVYGALKKAGLHVVKVDTKGDPCAAVDRADIDYAFIALHGVGGEDGHIQEILEKRKIPYTGAGPRASRNSFDKLRSKRLFMKQGIPTPASQLIKKNTYEKKIERVSFPLFLKPLCEGSSIGIRLLNDRRTIHAMITEAFDEYESFLLEERIFGREITVGVLGDAVLPIVELIPSGPYFDYASKYTKGQTRYSTRVDFSESDYVRYQELALKVFKILGIRDFGRVDMMIDDAGNPFVLELNSIPGMTETSLLPKAAAKIGIDFTELCLTILSFAVKRNSNK